MLLSPFMKRGTMTTHDYNHCSLLATGERLFGLAPLGDARSVPATFGSNVFTAKS